MGGGVPGPQLQDPWNRNLHGVVPGLQLLCSCCQLTDRGGGRRAGPSTSELGQLAVGSGGLRGYGGSGKTEASPGCISEPFIGESCMTTHTQLYTYTHAYTHMSDMYI